MTTEKTEEEIDLARRCFLRRALGKEGNQTHALQIEFVTANRIAEFSRSKDAACVANFQRRNIFCVRCGKKSADRIVSFWRES